MSKRYRRKSWQEKLADDKDLPRVVEITDDMSQRWGTGTVVIPAPREVDEIMRKVPGCPITTGIFASIAARATEEAAEEGKKNTTSYWRTLRKGGVINEKYPGGVEAQKKLLEKEGHIVVQKGKKYVVADFEKSLIESSV